MELSSEAMDNAMVVRLEGNLDTNTSTAAQWDNGETQELFMIRMLPELLDKVTRVIADNLRIEKLTILDCGNGDGLPTHVKNLTKSAVVLLEQMKNATGVDLAKLATQSGEEPGAEIPKELG